VSVRELVLLLALGASLVAGCSGGESAGNVTAPGEGVTRQIAGRWAGRLHQHGLPPFKVAVDISSNGDGEVAYTGIRCGGGWNLDEVQQGLPPRYVFTEEIKEGVGGSCKGTGTVSLAPIQGNTPNEPAYGQANYSFTGGGVTSRGLLHRTDAAGLARTFRQAGVTKP
jgi:hypothetical protein